MSDAGNGTDSEHKFAYSADRERGILTPSDREFLLERKTDYTEHSKKQKRNRIRRRVRNAILDFTILFEHLEDRDCESSTRAAFSSVRQFGCLAMLPASTTTDPKRATWRKRSLRLVAGYDLHGVGSVIGGLDGRRPAIPL